MNPHVRIWPHQDNGHRGRTEVEWAECLIPFVQLSDHKVPNPTVTKKVLSCTFSFFYSVFVMQQHTSLLHFLLIDPHHLAASVLWLHSTSSPVRYSSLCGIMSSRPVLRWRSLSRIFLCLPVSYPPISHSQSLCQASVHSATVLLAACLSVRTPLLIHTSLLAQWLNAVHFLQEPAHCLGLPASSEVKCCAFPAGTCLFPSTSCQLRG